MQKIYPLGLKIKEGKKHLQLFNSNKTYVHEERNEFN